ncbi:MAG: hypothetical protein LBK47_09240 [Prevotellaceae bacterium]|jgi:hypothetical protein|nr:hypothetical protein [Prevotellaceae bacterium]
MEYSDIFIPVSEHTQATYAARSSKVFGNSIRFAVKEFEWAWLQGFKVALIGLRRQGSPNSFPPLREAFYSLYQPTKGVDIIDLGDVEMAGPGCGEKVEFALYKLLEQGVFPLVFSESMRYSYLLYCALKAYQKTAAASYILSAANLGAVHEPLSDDNFLAHALVDYGKELSHLSVLGYQSYLTSPDDIRQLTALYCETLRLGLIRDENRLAEPLLRDADMLCAAVSAVRQSDAPAATEASPNGFYAEEMCRLLRFAGFSDKMKGFYLGGFNLTRDVNSQTAKLLAQMIWHVVDGIAHRVNEYPGDEAKSCRRLQVELGEQQDQQLVFYQSKITDRWWIEVPIDGSDRKQLIACLKEDYDQASHFEIPDRWLWFLKKSTLC